MIYMRPCTISMSVDLLMQSSMLYFRWHVKMQTSGQDDDWLKLAYLLVDNPPFRDYEVDQCSTFTGIRKCL